MNHGGASVLPGSEHVDNVGQEHKADDGEEHQQQHIQHDARRVQKMRRMLGLDEDGCVRWTGDPPRLLRTAVLSSGKMQPPVNGAKRWKWSSQCASSFVACRLGLLGANQALLYGKLKATT